MQCRAKSKRSGKRCLKHAVLGKRVCYIHGRKSKSGRQSGLFVNGRYTKDLPTRLGARFAEAMENESLLDLRADVALTDSFMGELVSRLDDGETGHIWKDLAQLCKKAAKQKEKSNLAGFWTTFQAIATRVDEGASEYQKRREIISLQKHRKELVESMRRARIEAEQLITVEQMMLSLLLLTQIIDRHVTDPTALAGITADINREILALPTRQP